MDKLEHWHICDGTNGTPNLQGKFLEGVTSISDIKILKNAGLPNIKGSINHGYIPTQSTSLSYSGALYYGLTYKQGCSWLTGTGAWSFAYSYLDAARYNSIYSDSITTVQPSSYTVVYIIRIS